ncbi:MAG: DUF481 domain-containing protein [Pseudomonadota bacterium]
MLRRKRFCLAAAFAMPAQAQVAGEISLGYLATSGNTRTESFNSKLALDYTADAWKNHFETLAVYSYDREGASAERYAALDSLDWNFTGRDYVFVALEWEKDLFGAIRTRTSESVGYGRHLLAGPVHLLEAEIGVGARQTEENVTGVRDDDLIFRGRTRYEWKPSETSYFVQSLKVESGESNTYGESLTELKLSIVGNLFATLSYTVKHNADVPPDTERTDTYSAVSLSYAFGA